MVEEVGNSFPLGSKDPLRSQDLVSLLSSKVEVRTELAVFVAVVHSSVDDPFEDLV